MPKKQLSTKSPLLPADKITNQADRITWWFLAVVLAGGLIYVCFGWTPSSYGVVFDTLDAQGVGPLVGTSRPVRSDEWAIETPYFQAAIRNRFRRVNETSFYREDLRNFYALPLADWSLAFKPQLWAFFVFPPAAAFSLYWALMMCGFLAGYHLLFRQLGVASWLAVVTAVMLFCTGFVQFWWTTYAPLLAGLPWILIVVLEPGLKWKKALICAWAFPALVLSHAYPTLLITLAWASTIVILAFRPTLLRSSAELLALAAGALAAAAVAYAYYAEVIPIMRNTVYPGHRISPAGDLPIFVVLSQIFPALTFRLSNYQNFTGENICEIGAVGSLLPLLTLCLTRYRALRSCAKARNALLILLTGFAAITVYELAPLPGWIGQILLWNTGGANRWLFTSGFVLMLASLVIWSNNLISLHPFRFTLFVLIGPIAAVLLKSAWLAGQADTSQPGLFERPDEILLCGLVLIAGIATWYIPASARAPVVLIAIALTNVYAFGRFNPLQPAKPIFEAPDSYGLRTLRAEAAAAPDGVLVEPRIVGSVLNGLGFRSVNHALLAPRLDVFRRYFPAMDGQRFNFIFNRYAYVSLTQKPTPDTVKQVLIEVPEEVFKPVRNVRRLVSGQPPQKGCSQPTAGGVGKLSTQANTLTIEGWAPWKAERMTQGIRVLSARSLGPASLTTLTRPDIAEQLQDYDFVKSGFRLQISSTDGKPLRPDELVLFAFGTAQGEVRLACCECP